MAGTKLKKLLDICIEGAQNAANSKEKLEFLRIAVILQGKKIPKEQLAEISGDMAKLLGMST